MSIETFLLFKTIINAAVSIAFIVALACVAWLAIRGPK